MEAADITSEAGLDGVDSPVRPGGEIVPNGAMDDLPRYVEILHRREPAAAPAYQPQSQTPHRLTPKRCSGWRRGWAFNFTGWDLSSGRQAPLRRSKWPRSKAQLKDLAALNKEIGICGLLQITRLQGAQPISVGPIRTARGGERIRIRATGIAFDIGHALVVHGDDWRAQFEKLKSHFKLHM